jgi:hypothetical protein
LIAHLSIRHCWPLHARGARVGCFLHPRVTQRGVVVMQLWLAQTRFAPELLMIQLSESPFWRPIEQRRRRPFNVVWPTSVGGPHRRYPGQRRRWLSRSPGSSGRPGASMASIGSRLASSSPCFVDSLDRGGRRGRPLPVLRSRKRLLRVLYRERGTRTPASECTQIVAAAGRAAARALRTCPRRRRLMPTPTFSAVTSIGSSAVRGGFAPTQRLKEPVCTKVQFANGKPLTASVAVPVSLTAMVFPLRPRLPAVKVGVHCPPTEP